jgi:hypothetical protein
MQSGLLAAVAAQLLQYFRDDSAYHKRQSSEAAKTAVLALCYAAIFLNIGATISAFVIIDKMGALSAAASSRGDKTAFSTFDGTEVRLLENFGAGSTWKYVMAECKQTTPITNRSKETKPGTSRADNILCRGIVPCSTPFDIRVAPGTIVHRNIYDCPHSSNHHTTNGISGLWISVSVMNSRECSGLLDHDNLCIH